MPLLVRIYRNFLAVFTETLKGNNAFYQGKQGVVLAAADVIAGVNLGAALPINDIAGFNAFAAKFFTTKALAARVSAVP